MLRLQKLALRNILRNKKRTIITISTIFFGVFASLMARGMIGAVQHSITTSVTKSVMGDFQIHAEGYLKSVEAAPLNMTIDDGHKIFNILDEKKVKYSKRINFGGLIYPDEERSTIFKGTAIDPVKELEVCPQLTSFLVEGRMLSDDDIYEALITKTLAENLGLTIGSEIILVGKDRNDFLSITDMKVVGIIEPFLPGIGNKLVYINIEAAMEFLDLYSESSEIVAATDRLQDSEIVFNEIKAAISAENMGVEIHFWDEIGKMFKKIIDFQKIIANIITIIFFIIVTTAIINTMLMAVLERTNEVGMIRAMGMKSRKVVGLFIIESLFLGFFGGSAGVLTATILTTVLNILGIKFVPPGSNTAVMLKPYFSIQAALLILIIAILTGIIASFYPSLYAGKLKPANALRKN